MGTFPKGGKTMERFEKTVTEKETILSGAKISRKGDNFTLTGSLITKKSKVVYRASDKDHHFRIVSRKRMPDKTEPFETPLQITTPTELNIRRKLGTPTLVYKWYEKLLCCEVPRSTYLSSELNHTCASGGKTCHRLLDLPYEKGGCDKVRKHANYIHLFDFIREGYETFNVSSPSFIVINCMDCNRG